MLCSHLRLLSLRIFIGFYPPAILAYMLDSLVRVSRRVDWGHFVNILDPHKMWSTPTPMAKTPQLFARHPRVAGI